jgi:hypothetical protein
MHPAVPPMQDTISGGTVGRRVCRTSGYNDVYLINVIRKLIVDTHGERVL